MVFDGHPCVFWYISENQKQAISASFLGNRGLCTRESHISFNNENLYYVKTEDLSVHSDTATALHCFVITAYWTKVG